GVTTKTPKLWGQLKNKKRTDNFDCFPFQLAKLMCCKYIRYEYYQIKFFQNYKSVVGMLIEELSLALLNELLNRWTDDDELRHSRNVAAIPSLSNYMIEVDHNDSTDTKHTTHFKTNLRFPFKPLTWQCESYTSPLLLAPFNQQGMIRFAMAKKKNNNVNYLNALDDTKANIIKNETVTSNGHFGKHILIITLQIEQNTLSIANLFTIRFSFTEIGNSFNVLLFANTIAFDNNSNDTTNNNKKKKKNMNNNCD
ncbi:hypothetical protein RFI_17948, partial [Reticulomyxa filosa]